MLTGWYYFAALLLMLYEEKFVKFLFHNTINTKPQNRHQALSVCIIFVPIFGHENIQ